MKNVLLISPILLSLALTSCSIDSANIIGGADGPTNIVVSGSAENSKITPIKMMCIDGELYYDTQKLSESTARCGTMDGELLKTVSEFEIPTQNNSCNFKNTSGYQHSSEMTKEVPVDNEWHIFSKINEPEKDLFKYQYCYILTGTMPNADKESKLLVLSNESELNFERVTKAIYSSDSKDSTDIYIMPID